jgi:predicted HTH domain antitoxin
MPVLRIPYDDALLGASHESREELEAEMRFLLAAKLYELGRASAGQAGKLAGLPRLRFLDELARRGFTVVHLEREALEDELRDDPAEVHQ